MAAANPLTSINNDDLVKALICSDIHLGYAEKDQLRGDDSFVAFEEILQHAMENAVDLILLGGDLFHDANPSPHTLNRCMKLLRAYTMGDKPIRLQFLSDQNVNFMELLNKTVNYQDPNLNISIPVFSIHGNHDDPSGFGRLSSLDLLSTTGLLNYFGKWTDLTKIEISPLMFKKGNTRLALYGLSYIQDNRLARLFAEAKVTMVKPDDKNEWFNIMVVHQNRADRGIKNYLPEEILPNFLDFVLWGHEHDCRIAPEKNPKKQFWVCQPGSSVATSLAEGEARDKHCGLLLIHRKQFKMVPIKLKTVRPFIFRSHNLADLVEELNLDEGDVQKNTIKFAEDQIAEMMVEAISKLSGYEKQPKIPLIRLRLECSDEDQMFNTVRFGQNYLGKVANAGDIVTFKKNIKRTKAEIKPVDRTLLADAFAQESAQDGVECRVEAVVEKYFLEVDETKRMDVLFPKCLSELCRRLVDQDDDDAAENILDFQIEKACEYLEENGSTIDNVDDLLVGFRDKEDEILQGMLKRLDDRSKKGGSRSAAMSLVSDDDDVAVLPQSKQADISIESMNGRNNKTVTTATRGGRGRGRGSRGGKVGSTTTKKEKTTKTSKQPSIDKAFTKNQTNRFMYNDSESD